MEKALELFGIAPSLRIVICVSLFGMERARERLVEFEYAKK
jgi:hypothetical protein